MLSYLQHELNFCDQQYKSLAQAVRMIAPKFREHCLSQDILSIFKPNLEFGCSKVQNDRTFDFHDQLIMSIVGTGCVAVGTRELSQLDDFQKSSIISKAAVMRPHKFPGVNGIVLFSAPPTDSDSTVAVPRPTHPNCAGVDGEGDAG